jgi:hypothetical protein
MNQKIIVIDGKTYKSVDEMPPDIRAKYEEAMRGLDRDRNGMPDILDGVNPFEDKNKDGMPDAFEGLAAIHGATPTVMSSTKIVVNGQVYEGLDQLPPEVRAKYEEAMGSMDKNRNGIPDFVEGMFNVSTQTRNTTANNAPTALATSASRPASRNPLPASSTIEPESSGGWMLALAGLALVGLCLVAAAAGVWYFFLR